MGIVPTELKQQELPRRLFGYKRAAVDELLDKVHTSFELTWRERSDLTDRVHQLESDLSKHVELEGMLRSTLISAERTAQAHRERALKEADAVINEAHAKAREITRQAQAERERLSTVAREVASLLRSSLAGAEAATALTGPPAPAQPQAEQPRPDQQPRQETALRDPTELGVVKKLAG
jgi:cell division initiation protein